MDIVILLLALTVTTGLTWSLAELLDHAGARSGRRPAAPRHRPW